MDSKVSKSHSKSNEKIDTQINHNIRDLA